MRDGDFQPEYLELVFGDGETSDPVELEPGLRVRGRIDRIDTNDGMALVIDYKSGKKADSYKVSSWESENRFQAALYMLVVERLLTLRAAGGVYLPLGERRAPARDGGQGGGRARLGLRQQRPPGPRGVPGEARVGARAGARHRLPDARGRAGLQAGLLRLERRLFLSLDLPVRVVSARRSALTPEQARAVARRDGSLMVRAGAGTGKTTVLVERFVQAVVEDGEPVEGILAITFTEKAAAEMKTRVRSRFLELERRADARAAEGAWISTIHGFCSRVLRIHALSAGIDPDFRVLDELEAERVAADAFDGALGRFMGDGEDPERLEMVAAYTPDRLRDMVSTAHSRLRSQGHRRPRLAEAKPPPRTGQRERLEAAARAAARRARRRRRGQGRGRSAGQARALPGGARADSGRRAGGPRGPRQAEHRHQRQRALDARAATTIARR